MSEAAIPLLQAAVAALRAGRDAEAIGPLERALSMGLSPELAPRARSLMAQALTGLGRLGEAQEQVDAAIRQARALGDREGLGQLRQLSGRIRAAAAARREAARRAAGTAATPLRELLDPQAPPLEQAMVLIRKADAELDAGRAAAGSFLARRALELASAGEGGDRERVYALLALARAAPQRAEELLSRALAIADEANNQAMITAVARAAKAAGVAFAPREF